MRLIYGLAVGLLSTAAAAYGELVVDMRTPKSSFTQVHGLGASAQLSLVTYNKKLADMRAAYGPGANVTLHPSTGDMVVDLDGETIEVDHLRRSFAGMYGMFVVIGDKDGASIFPFALDPGSVPGQSDHEPNVGRLQDHFDERLPARYLAFGGDSWERNSCAATPVAEMGLGSLAQRLRLQRQIACVIRWKGPNPATMLVAVTLADGDPWMRPFARRICRPLVEAALARLDAAKTAPPNFAACVLVDRAGRTGATEAQDAFTSVVYELGARGLARID